FPNQPCIGQASKNGTCYTADECSAKSGTNSGSCAQGYGVCCTCKFLLNAVSATCGQTSNENCTYFESAGSEIGGCSLTICPCGDNICQVKELASGNDSGTSRRERGNCRICYTTVMESDFMTSGETVEMAFAKPSECCGYGSTGGKSRFDCVVIPGALNPAMMSEQGLFSQFSDRQPFNIRFLSDSFEAETEIMLGVMAGFKLTYFQTSNGCN
ncbi:hypothetical protein TCAL_15494, partial [Tigriopus californicus]